GVHDVPVVIRELDDTEAAEIALIENVQRVDLNPMEEAAAYARLADVYGRTQDEISKAVGKSRSHVANMMRLMTLPSKCRKAVEEGALSMGHARALLGADKPDEALAHVLKAGLNVRDTESFVRRLNEAPPAKPGAIAREPAKPSVPGKKDADTRALEADLAAALGLEVSIDHTPKGSGVLTIGYRSLDQLDDVCKRLMGTGV
ncbi:MAG TPA: ParB/RepB/Spo0J family partition protein, partial [Parvularculaceae bacterium]|nr:ParB/RepB/Spo0J family partition protein [Parvularculaceae bacterium]